VLRVRVLLLVVPALQGVDYARRAANRRAMWGDYEDEEEQQEEWSG
jgi:hypothetical protein